MVTVSYRAEEQMKRLSSGERDDLERTLERAESDPQAIKTDSSSRFVSKFGDNMRVVWSKDERGNIIVLTVVAR